MRIQKGQQNLTKLPFNRGGFFHIPLSAEVVQSLPEGAKTRIICELDERVRIRCGLNPLGKGAYFILIAKRYVEALEKKEHDLNFNNPCWRNSDSKYLSLKFRPKCFLKYVISTRR